MDAAKRSRQTQALVKEDGFHQSVADLLDYVLLRKAVVWSTFPAGGYALTRAAAGRLYRLGLKPGIPDILIWWNGKTYGIELKTVHGHLSPAQREMHIRLKAAGMTIRVCRDINEVLWFLREHKIPMRNVTTGVNYGYTASEGRSAAQSP